MKNVSIKAKIIAISVLPIVGLLIIVSAALVQLGNTKAGVDRIYNDRVVPLEDLKVIADDYAVLVIDAINKANAGMISASDAANDIVKAEEEIAAMWKKYMATELTVEETRLAKEAEALFRTADQAIKSVVLELRKVSGDAKGKLDSIDGPMYADIDPISEKITELVNLQLRVAKEERDSIDEAYSFELVLLTSITAAVVLSLIILSWVVYKSVKEPLDLMQKTMERISDKSDLTATVDVDGENELAQIAKSFNEMVSQMRHLISQIANATNQLSGSADIMTNISVSANQSINSQRLEIEQVSAAMNEMVATAQEIASNAETADLDARNTSTQAQSGNQIVDEAVNSTNELVSDVESVSERIHTLESDSESIGSVVDVIKGIAEQTNLLALNAAIEAARAGDQGRGFAVVADEVRTLAQRTQTSTQEIQEAIERLQAGTRSAVIAMNAGQERAKSAGEKAAEAGQALQTIATAVDGITGMNAQIASASEEQTSVAEEINRSLVTIHDASNESASGAEQIASSSEELSRLSEELKTLVTKFTV